MKVRVYIYDGYELSPADPDGNSDPYLKLMYQGKELGKLTRQKPEKQNPARPIFFQHMSALVDFPKKSFVTLEGTTNNCLREANIFIKILFSLGL